MKTKVIFVLIGISVVFACFGVEVTNVASSVSASNGASIVDKSWEVAKNYVPEVRGNALWDILKWALVFGYKAAVGIVLLFFLIPALVSQRLRTIWFRKGVGTLRMLRAESFGELVSVEKERSQYRRISSNKRDEVVRRLNEHSGVFLVMGPAGAGKGVLVRAESAAKYVLRVEGRQWYDGSSESTPVREILKQRTRLLTRWLPFRKPVCIILEWDPMQELPDDWRMNKMLADLARFLGSRSEFDKLSFVVKVPAYYSLDSLSQRDLGNGLQPEVLSVNLLAPSECESLFNEQLSSMEDKDPEEVSKCRARLGKRAEGHGVSIAKMIWVESFGRPRYVVDIIKREFHDSLEAWKGLRDWWLQVYAPEKTKQNWLAYLYVLALRAALRQDGEVDLEETFRGSGLDYLNEVYPAIKRLCAKEKFRTKNFDVALIFGKDDNFIRDSYLQSLGLMEKGIDEKGSRETVFDFQDQLATAFSNLPEAKDAEACERIACFYHNLNESEPNLVERLERHYAFMGRLQEVFGKGRLVDAYRRLMDDPVLAQRFLEEVVSRLGALNTEVTKMLFERLDKVCDANLSDLQYVDHIYAMLPVYVISSYYAIVWHVSFDKIMAVAIAPTTNAKTLFRCAMIEQLAMVAVENGVKLPDFRAFHEKREGELARILEMLRQGTQEREEFDLIVDFMAMRQLPDESLTQSFNDKENDVRMAWICAFAHVMGWCASDNDNPDILFYHKVVQDVLATSVSVGLEQMLVRYAFSFFDYDFNLSSEEGIGAWRKDVVALTGFLDRWSECPVLAKEHFERLCNDYKLPARSAPGLLNGKDIWSLVQILKEWRTGMADVCYSTVLASFANLLAEISKNTDIEFLHVWREYSGEAISFWTPRMVSLDDTCMRGDYFSMIMSVSNIDRISAEERSNFVRHLRQTPVFLRDDLKSAGHVELIKDYNDTIFSSATKYLFAAEVLTGIPLAKNVSGDAEILQAAEDILAQARAEGRLIDEDLVREFRRMNGLEET